VFESNPRKQVCLDLKYLDRFSQKMVSACTYDKCGLKFLSTRSTRLAALRRQDLLLGLRSEQLKHLRSKETEVWRMYS